MKRGIAVIFFISFFVYSCEWIGNNGGDENVDIVKGLKTALQVGKDSAVKFTSAVDGYYKDQVIKILLPPEAQVVYQYINNPLVQQISYNGKNINALIGDVELSMNRAAEYAAPKAKGIFARAIENMTISDGLTILNGRNPADSSKSLLAGEFDSLAATHYLKSMTYTSLVDSFSPPMTDALSKDLGLGFSANTAWSSFTSAYNTVANNSFGLIQPIATTDLGKYATGKALDGLFYKVGEQERLIRRDPWHWASTAVGDILTKVFGKSQ